jgi:glucokinase
MRLWTGVSGKPWPEGKTVKDLASAAFGKESNSDFSREEAREAFAEAGRCLGEILASPLRENEMECLLVGGQIAKSFALMEPSLRAALSHLPSLQSISSLPNLDTATFDGLQALLTGQ